MIEINQKILEQIERINLVALSKKEGWNLEPFGEGWLCREMEVYLTEHRFYSFRTDLGGGPLGFLVYVLGKDVKEVFHDFSEKCD